MIASPNFPSNYGNNENCEWNLRGPTGHFLTLTFLTFNLESSSSCNSADYLEIRDVNSTGTTSVWDSFKFSCEILFFLNWLFVKSFQCNKSYCFNNQYVLILFLFHKGPVLITVCGTQVPQPIMTSDSYAHVKFVSNNANTFPGFQLKFEASVEGKQEMNWRQSYFSTACPFTWHNLFLRIHVNMEGMR